MDLFIHKYLSRHYEIGTTSENSKKLKLIVTYGVYHRDDESKFKDEINYVNLLKDLHSVFGLNEKQAKSVVNAWAKTKNRFANLKTYWKKNPFLSPQVRRLTPSLISNELISVQPMSGPTGNLFFLDRPTTGTTEYIPRPNENGRIYPEEIVRQSWFPLIEGKSEAWNEQIRELLNNQRNHTIGISSRKIR